MTDFGSKRLVRIFRFLRRTLNLRWHTSLLLVNIGASPYRRSHSFHLRDSCNALGRHNCSCSAASYCCRHSTFRRSKWVKQMELAIMQARLMWLVGSIVQCFYTYRIYALGRTNLGPILWTKFVCGIVVVVCCPICRHGLWESNPQWSIV